MRIGVSTAQPRSPHFKTHRSVTKISVNQINLPIEKTLTENVCGLNLLDYNLFHNNVYISAYECTHRNAYIHKQRYTCLETTKWIETRIKISRPIRQFASANAMQQFNAAHWEIYHISEYQLLDRMSILNRSPENNNTLSTIDQVYYWGWSSL